MEIFPGTRVKAFDTTLYKNDKLTPLSMTMKPATVVCRYGYRSYYHPEWVYPDLVDVKFDHRKDYISHGHFTNSVELIGE